MLSFEATNVASLRFFCGALEWLHLDELKEALGVCIEPMCQFRWRLLIIHG